MTHTTVAFEDDLKKAKDSDSSDDEKPDESEDEEDK